METKSNEDGGFPSKNQRDFNKYRNPNYIRAIYVEKEHPVAPLASSSKKKKLDDQNDGNYYDDYDYGRRGRRGGYRGGNKYRGSMKSVVKSSFDQEKDEEKRKEEERRKFELQQKEEEGKKLTKQKEEEEKLRKQKEEEEIARKKAEEEIKKQEEDVEREYKEKRRKIQEQKEKMLKEQQEKERTLKEQKEKERLLKEQQEKKQKEEEELKKMQIIEYELQQQRIFEQRFYKKKFDQKKIEEKPPQKPAPPPVNFVFSEAPTPKVFIEEKPSKPSSAIPPPLSSNFVFSPVHPPSSISTPSFAAVTFDSYSRADTNQRDYYADEESPGFNTDQDQNTFFFGKNNNSQTQNLLSTLFNQNQFQNQNQNQTQTHEKILTEKELLASLKDTLPQKQQASIPEFESKIKEKPQISDLNDDGLDAQVTKMEAESSKFTKIPPRFEEIERISPKFEEKEWHSYSGNKKSPKKDEETQIPEEIKTKIESQIQKHQIEIIRLQQHKIDIARSQAKNKEKEKIPIPTPQVLAPFTAVSKIPAGASTKTISPAKPNNTPNPPLASPKAKSPQKNIQQSQISDPLSKSRALAFPDSTQSQDYNENYEPEEDYQKLFYAAPTPFDVASSIFAEAQLFKRCWEREPANPKIGVPSNDKFPPFPPEVANRIRNKFSNNDSSSMRDFPTMNEKQGRKVSNYAPLKPYVEYRFVDDSKAPDGTERFVLYCKKCKKVLDKCTFFVETVVSGYVPGRVVIPASNHDYFGDILSSEKPHFEKLNEKSHSFENRNKIKEKIKESAINHHLIVELAQKNASEVCLCFLKRWEFYHNVWVNFMILDKKLGVQRELISIFQFLGFDCLAQHELYFRKRPICPHFSVFGSCTNEDCPFRHQFLKSPIHSHKELLKLSNPPAQNTVILQKWLQNINTLLFDYNQDLKERARDAEEEQIKEKMLLYHAGKPHCDILDEQSNSTTMGDVFDANGKKMLYSWEKKRYYIDQFVTAYPKKKKTKSIRKGFGFAIYDDKQRTQKPARLHILYPIHLTQDKKKFTVLIADVSLTQKAPPKGRNAEIQFLDKNLRLFRKVLSENPMLSLFSHEDSTWITFFHCYNVTFSTVHNFKSIFKKFNEDVKYQLFTVNSSKTYRLVENPVFRMCAFPSGANYVSGKPKTMKSKIAILTTESLFEMPWDDDNEPLTLDDELPSVKNESFNADKNYGSHFSNSDPSVPFIPTLDIISACFDEDVAQTAGRAIESSKHEQNFEELKFYVKFCGCSAKKEHGFLILSCSIGFGHAIVACQCKSKTISVLWSTAIDSNFWLFPKYSRIINIKYDSRRELLWVLVQYHAEDEMKENNVVTRLRMYFFDVFTRNFLHNHVLELQFEDFQEAAMFPTLSPIDSSKHYVESDWSTVSGDFLIASRGTHSKQGNSIIFKGNLNVKEKLPHVFNWPKESFFGNLRDFATQKPGNLLNRMADVRLICK